jgi:hypothetical protein
MRRRGFALVEQLIALVLLALYAGVLVVVVRGAGRVASRTAGSLLADRAVGAVTTFLEEELRDGGDSDVAVLAATRVALSRPIGEGSVCADSAGAVLLRDTTWLGNRPPQPARDDVELLLDPVAGLWIRVPIDSVTAASCPLDGASATRLAVVPHAGHAALARVLEPVELSAYRSGAADWFGLTPASHASAVQPFAGPLVPATTAIVASPGLLTTAMQPGGQRPVQLQLPLGSPP